MAQKEKEIRTLGTIQVRSTNDGTVSRRIEGTAVVFNSDSQDLGGFIEQILPESIDQTTIDTSDVFATLDHDPSRGILARSRRGKGTLELTLDEKGLHYAFDAPHTALGDEVLEMIKRGEIFASSFAFTVADDEWVWDESGFGRRFVKKIDRLYDIAPVFEPAYLATSAVTRKLGDTKALFEKLGELQKDFQ